MSDEGSQKDWNFEGMIELTRCILGKVYDVTPGLSTSDPGVCASAIEAAHAAMSIAIADFQAEFVLNTYNVVRLTMALMEDGKA